MLDSARGITQTMVPADEVLFPSRESLCGEFFCSCSKCIDQKARFIIFAMKCKSWDCPECRKEKARIYQERIKKLFDGRKLWFLTFTYLHYQSVDLAWASYNKAWNRLRTNLVKQFGKFSYVRVLESHNQSNYPHLHIIVDKYFIPTKIGPAAVSAGFGWQMKNKLITTEGAKVYVTKYLTKPWKNREGWNLRRLYRCRLISFSNDLRGGMRAKVEWNMLMRAGSFEDCRTSVDTAISWDTEYRFELIEEKDFGDLYIADYCMIERPPGSLELRDDWYG